MIEGRPDVIYMTFNTACNFSAIDDLIKGSSAPVGISMTNKSLEDLRVDLAFDYESGPKQNLRYRDAEGNTIDSRDPALYLMFALKGGFGNETNRYLLSDFRGDKIEVDTE